MLHDFHEARKYFRRHDRSINTNITLKIHLYVGHHTDIDDQAPLPEILSDQDCYVEVALPSESELKDDESFELIGRMLKEDSSQPISLDDVLRLFHIDPDAKIWTFEKP